MMALENKLNNEFEWKISFQLLQNIFQELFDALEEIESTETKRKAKHFN